MSEISVNKEIKKRYRNHYKCSECGHEWQDDWDSTCNDRCPKCNTEIEPYKSEDIVDEPECEGTEGQDRKSYSDDQDRDSYTVSN